MTERQFTPPMTELFSRLKQITEDWELHEREFNDLLEAATSDPSNVFGQLLQWLRLVGIDGWEEKQRLIKDMLSLIARGQAYTFMAAVP